MNIFNAVPAENQDSARENPEPIAGGCFMTSSGMTQRLTENVKNTLERALTRTLQPQQCASDIDCACRCCLDEMAAERTRRAWRDEWLGMPTKATQGRRLAFSNGEAGQ